MSCTDRFTSLKFFFRQLSNYFFTIRRFLLVSDECHRVLCASVSVSLRGYLGKICPVPVGENVKMLFHFTIDFFQLLIQHSSFSVGL